MNSTSTRTVEFSADHVLTVSDVRSLLEWLNHFKFADDQRVLIRAEDSQKDGYWFRASVTMTEAVREELVS